MTANPLQPYLDQLAGAEDRLDHMSRVELALKTIELGHDDSVSGPEIGNVMLNLHPIVNSGTTPERVDQLVQTLRLISPDARRTLSDAAGRAASASDVAIAGVWVALAALVDAIDQPPAAS